MNTPIAMPQRQTLSPQGGASVIIDELLAFASSRMNIVYLFIKTYLYRVLHNQLIIILFYSVSLLLANGKSSDNLKIKHYLRHDMCSQSFLKRM